MDVELQTDGDTLNGGGLSFYERERLSSADLALAKSFIVSLSTTKHDFDRIMTSVRTSIEQEVFQVDHSSVITSGPMRIHAGKVGNEQTLSIAILADDPVSTTLPAPEIALRPSAGTASRCDRVAIGTSWDNALSELNTGGKRIKLISLSPDRFTDVRDFGGTTCRFTFERPSSPELGPYRLVSVQ